MQWRTLALGSICTQTGAWRQVHSLHQLRRDGGAEGAEWRALLGSWADMYCVITLNNGRFGSVSQNCLNTILLTDEF